ncbi:DUF4832 domain-containing protein [Actimicrobium sp. CCI2.3]|uniref:DUF4832 domain-containing protein n=1 Tax=Actimicrobium sp. CCI2.3 TaxID=3048616 RepID=UPI002AB36F39|nr:DUF4832 domain-containing protein [Actimicrobium sp. CCI2.3]MDY7574084.1 DUF4832 domain-containing protein [Actimicrobium sp. CCI2.3]MEB0023930.1 DUF4832 domain-containing protein [Actimicrobium sp. CCI2.3]
MNTHRQLNKIIVAHRWSAQVTVISLMSFLLQACNRDAVNAGSPALATAPLTLPTPTTPTTPTTVTTPSTPSTSTPSLVPTPVTATATATAPVTAPVVSSDKGMTVSESNNTAVLKGGVSPFKNALTKLDPSPNPPTTAHTYKFNNGPLKNPLKGWSGAQFYTNPEWTVGHQYIDWSGFEPSQGHFDYPFVENIINQPGSKGKHVVLRLFCDFWSNVPTHCPQWIRDQIGVATITGKDNAKITDYNDTRYVDRAKSAIAALAYQYDKDPRVMAFELGLLGYFGEWHTARFTNLDGSGYNISTDTKSAILNAYETNFTQKKLEGRYPWDETLKKSTRIGFHNDVFNPNNSQSNDFNNNIFDHPDLVKYGPIGGEVPDRNNDELKAEKPLLLHGAGATMINNGHYSYMFAGAYNVNPGETDYDKFLDLSKLMGYNYQIKSANFADTLSKQDTMYVDIEVENIGVAPISYDWNVEFALLNNKYEPVTSSQADCSLTKVLGQNDVKPSTTTSGSTEVPPPNVVKPSTNLILSKLSPGDYKVAVRISQPGATEKKDVLWGLDARNVYIQFANESVILPEKGGIPTLTEVNIDHKLLVVEGKWGSDNEFIGGWSVLGTATVTGPK